MAGCVIDKPPGLDCSPYVLYKCTLNILGHLRAIVYMAWQQDGLIYGFVRIEVMRGRNGLQNDSVDKFRPFIELITALNILAKRFAKTMTCFADDLIRDTHAFFIPVRGIQSNLPILRGDVRVNVAGIGHSYI